MNIQTLWFLFYAMYPKAYETPFHLATPTKAMRLYQCNVKCCNDISLLNYLSIVGKKGKRNANIILIFWPKYNGDKNENNPYTRDRTTEDMESSERNRDSEQNSGRKNFKEKTKSQKKPWPALKRQAAISGRLSKGRARYLMWEVLQRHPGAPVRSTPAHRTVSPFQSQLSSWTAMEPGEKQEGSETMDITLESYL